MGRHHILTVLISAAMAAATAYADTGSVAYVQATITEPNAGAGTLGYVTASGRSRVARVRGAAAASLRDLRPGDEVILTIEGSAENPAVTSVKVSRVVPAAPLAEAAVGAYAWTQAVPSRPSWPNPYSRINPGLPPRQARRTAAPAAALTVMPAALGAANGTRGPVAAPAVLATTTAVAVPAPPPATSAPDETSTVDALRARGARDFETAVRRLADEARAVDAAYARYTASCPKAPAAGDASRPWFSVWDGVAVSDGDPGCAALLDEVMRLGSPIKTSMLAAREAARRAWVLPGTMSDIRRRHAMEWSGWDR